MLLLEKENYWIRPNAKVFQNFKLLQSATKVYYKVWQILQSATNVYYKVWQVLLQSATKSSLQSVTGITKCDSYYKVWQKFYYKVRQVLQSVTGITKCDRNLLQSVTGITKCDSYYKVRQYTP